MMIVFFFSLNNGLIRSFFTNRNPISANSARSLINDVSGVIGRQSPKQPQFLNFPEIYAYPVRKVKKMMSNNNSQLNNRVLHPNNKANPAMISNAFINTDM